MCKFAEFTSGNDKILFNLQNIIKFEPCSDEGTWIYTADGKCTHVAQEYDYIKSELQKL